jgi:hypothetical protein
MTTLLLAAAIALCPRATVDVLVFNVEYGGGLVDFGKTVEVIKRSGADLVLVEEAWGQMPRLARALGWTEYDARHQVLARRPLLDPREGGGRFLYFEASPGCVVAVANVHLPSDPDPPDAMADAAAVAAGMAVERRSRLRALEPTLAALKPLLAAGTGVLLGGDFNAPSHLDDPRYPWPVSLALAGLGLRDVWRTAHPDPKARPGHTWWAARPAVDGWNPSPGARQVRIDQLHVGGDILIEDARVMGEAGHREAALTVSPWPSDHRALLARLAVRGSPAPPLITAWPPRVVRGQPLRIRTRGVGAKARVVLTPAADGRPPASGARSALPEDMRYPTAELAPGAYHAALLAASGRRLAAAPFWILPEGAPPRVELERVRAKVGAPVDVSWSGAPASRWDWVGVYPAHEAPASGRQPLLWRHTGATVAGEARLDAEAEGEGWPLPAGAYRVFLFEDDRYDPLASAALTVEP